MVEAVIAAQHELGQARSTMGKIWNALCLADTVMSTTIVIVSLDKAFYSLTTPDPGVNQYPAITIKISS